VTINQRIHCRKCRGKLPEPTDNHRRAFDTRFCFESFYRNRCVVCEGPFRRRSSSQRTCIRPDCKADLRRFPLAYSWPETAGTAHTPRNDIDPLKSPDFIGSGRPLETTRPIARSLRGWSWNPETGFERELRDRNGNLLARLEHNGGRCRLTYPRTFPILSWADSEQAKGCAESLALSNLPTRRARSGGAP
jgi:hypothetical protein